MSDSVENRDKVQNNERIYLNNKDDETVNSKKLRSFIWKSDDSNKYEKGKLIIRFSNGYVYAYNVPRKSYIELCKSAYNGTDPFKTYDKNMINWVTEQKKSEESVLYVDRYKIS